MIRSRELGVALVQVLIISIILSMLAIYVSQTLKSQIGIASRIKSYHEEVLQIESTEAEILHALLTEKHYYSIKGDNKITSQWNFYGKPFQINDNVAIKIQDLSSLISLNYFNRALSQRLFIRLGKDDKDIRSFIDSLADWKDKDDLKHINGAESNYYEGTIGYGPRNSYLQSIEEVLLIKNGDLLSIKEWTQYFSLAFVSGFNPLNSPKDLMSAFIDNEQIAEDILRLRDENRLSGLSFYQATGIDEDDFISFRTGSIFRVSLFSLRDGSHISKSFKVEVRARSSLSPIQISEVVWNSL